MKMMMEMGSKFYMEEISRCLSEDGLLIWSSYLHQIIGHSYSEGHKSAMSRGKVRKRGSKSYHDPPFAQPD